MEINSKKKFLKNIFKILLLPDLIISHMKIKNNTFLQKLWITSNFYF